MYMKNKQHGFTLLELIVTISIVGIIAAIAIWNSSDMLEKNRAENFLLELKRNLNFARAKATSTDEIVVVCPAQYNQVKKGKATFGCKNKWDKNKIIVVFVDSDNDGDYDSDTDTLLRVMEKMPDNNKLSFTGGKRLAFDTSGRITTSVGKFTYCPDQDNKNNKALEITQSGTTLYNGDTNTTCN